MSTQGTSVVQAAAQVESIRRALSQKKIEEARARLADLRRLHPNYYSPPLAYEIEIVAGSVIPRVYAAWRWVQQSPHSELAWQALAESSPTDYPALSLHARRELRRIHGKPPDQALPSSSEDAAGMTLQEAVRFDLSRILTATGHHDEADGLLHGFQRPAMRAQRGVIAFARAKISEATELIVGLHADDRESIFAQARLAQLKLWGSGHAAAEPCFDELAESPLTRPEDALVQLRMLLFGGYNQQVEHCYQQTLGVPWPSHVSMAQVSYLGAFAAWRLGEWEEARARMQSVIDERNADAGTQNGRSEGPASLCVHLDQLIAAQGKSGEPPSLNQNPGWVLGTPEYWWPAQSLTRARKVSREQRLSLAQALGLPLPHTDYLHALSGSGGDIAVIGRLLLASNTNVGTNTGAKA